MEVTLEVMGGKWKPYLICYLKYGPKRPSELTKLIPGASKRVITQQLKELEEHGIIAKTIYPEIPLRTEYYLTAFGEGLVPVISMMENWGQQFRSRLEEAHLA